MPVYEITCPHCKELFELEIGLDHEATIELIKRVIKESDGGTPKFRNYREIAYLCGDTASSVGREELNKCVRYAVARGILEKRLIGHHWKFRWRLKPFKSSSRSRAVPVKEGDFKPLKEKVHGGRGSGWVSDKFFDPKGGGRRS